MIHVDERSRRVLVGDGLSNSLDVMSDDGAVVQHIPLSGAPVAWRQSGGEDYLATIGNFGTETNQSAVFVSRRLSGGLLDVVGSIVDGYPRISD
jgi:hypothetical protein